MRQTMTRGGRCSTRGRRSSPSISRARCSKKARGCLQKGTHDRALVAYRLARTVAERAGQPIGIAAATSRIAQTLSAIGDYDQALTLLRESEAIYREQKDRRSELQILNNQAIVHRLRGDLDAALAIQRRVLAAREADGDPVALGFTLNNIGVLQQGRGAYRDALASMQRALAYRKPGSPEYASTLHNLGTVYYAQGDLAVARDYCERALAVPGVDAMLTMNALTWLAEITRNRAIWKRRSATPGRKCSSPNRPARSRCCREDLRVLGLSALGSRPAAGRTRAARTERGGGADARRVPTCSARRWSVWERCWSTIATTRVR